jgi:hypothetical protein
MDAQEQNETPADTGSTISNETDTDVINYSTIEKALALILASRDWLTETEQEKILEELGDALGNHSQDLVLESDIDAHLDAIRANLKTIREERSGNSEAITDALHNLTAHVGALSRREPRPQSCSAESDSSKQSKSDEADSPRPDITFLGACDIGHIVTLDDHPRFDDPVLVCGYHQVGKHGAGVWALADPNTGEFEGMVEENGCSVVQPVTVVDVLPPDERPL